MAGKSTRPYRFLLVGIGPHAKRTFIKHFKDLKAEGRGEISAAVDLVSNREPLEKYAAEHLPGIELTLVPFFRQVMPRDVENQLNEVVYRLQIDCVIVSTEPECHKPYGLWAVRLGLHVIMDKPITTRMNACNDIDQAAGIASDFEELLKAYNELQTRKKTVFLINSHRRYHPGYQGTRDFISDIRDKTNCPVTSLISTHCDGQWRLPDEIVDQHYHPFKYGYGKVSHSGYHFLDSCYTFFKAGWSSGKHPDEIEMVSTFMRPNGFMSSVTHEEHVQTLGKEYETTFRYTPEELHWMMMDMGEMDAMLQITFKQNGTVLAIAQLNLFHTGFSRRDWVDQGPTPDLYKGCGRVKHEAHEVRSGPFQTIVIDSRQANDKHDRSKPSTAELGSDNHFEVQTWRNCGVLGEEEPLKVYTVDDLDRRYNTKLPGIYAENIKRGILLEAFDFFEGNTSLDELSSNLPDHSVPATLMSAAYVSHVRRLSGQNPVTRMDLSYANDTPRATLRAEDLLTPPATPPAIVPDIQQHPTKFEASPAIIF